MWYFLLGTMELKRYCIGGMENEKQNHSGKMIPPWRAALWDAEKSAATMENHPEAM